jgi:glycosyltransferase involved in cell wall biosynthesis
VPHAKIPLFMNACDAMIFTSMHEGSPNVVKEALACNLPVVSVEVGDVRRWLSRVDGCVVCADDKPATLTRALREVLQRNARVDGRPAILEIEESLLTQKVIQIYEKLL